MTYIVRRNLKLIKILFKEDPLSWTRSKNRIYQKIDHFIKTQCDRERFRIRDNGAKRKANCVRTYRMKTTVVKRVLRIPMDANINGTSAQGLVQGITSAVSLTQSVIVESGAYPGLQFLHVSLYT